MKIVGTLDRQRAEEALKESEEKHRILIETTDTGYVILDEEGRVLDANAEYIRLTGHEKLQQILGKKVTEWTAEHDLTRNAEEVKKCLNRGSVRNLEIDYVNKEGRFTPIEINATVLQTAKEKKIVTLCRDITERKRADWLKRAPSWLRLEESSALPSISMRFTSGLRRRSGSLSPLTGSPSTFRRRHRQRSAL